MNWSDEQAAIFSEAAVGQRHALIVARAGTGKTTVIVEAATRAPERRVIFLAFNKIIAEELERRITVGKASTFHSLGYGALMRSGKGGKLNQLLRKRRVGKAVTALHLPLTRNGIAAVADVVDLVKESRPTARTVEDIIPIVQAEGVDIETSRAPEDIAKLVLHVLEQSKVTADGITYADMLWLPVTRGLIHPAYDLLIVDECQDLSRSQLLMMLALSAGRIMLVGDDRQAIYGFRGAAPGAMRKLGSALQAVELPLRTTFRCSRRVTAEAARLVPDIVPRADAPEGSVRRITRQQLDTELRVGDVVLARVNAPLIRVCTAQLKRGVASTIVGADFATVLTRIIESLKTDHGLQQGISNWCDGKLRYTDHTDRAAVRLIKDQAAALMTLAAGCHAASDVLQRVSRLFTSKDDVNTVACSTVHKFKGRERNRVFLLESSFEGCEGDEELNIRYVAITRARHDLIYVEGDEDASV